MYYPLKKKKKEESEGRGERVKKQMNTLNFNSEIVRTLLALFFSYCHYLHVFYMEQKLVSQANK